MGCHFLLLGIFPTQGSNPVPMNNIFISFLSQARSLGIILRPPSSFIRIRNESYTAGLEKTCILNSYTCNIAATIQVQTTITSSLVSFRFPPPPIPCFLAILQSTYLPRPSCDFPGMGSRGCIPGSPGESGLVSRGSQGLRSPLESRRGSLGAP